MTLSIALSVRFKGTYVCVNRKESCSIKRSTDGMHWASVYDKQVDPKDQTYRFSHVVFGHVKPIVGDNK